jgi:hypothetical protein
MNFVAVWMKKMKDEDEDDKTFFDVQQTCTACGWQGKGQDRDRVPDPRSQKIWYVCPRCRMPENFKEV